MDDYGNYLSYTVGQLDVYRNGVHLVDSQDFIANNSTQIRNLSTMNIGDVVDVVTLSATGVTITNLLSGGGTVFQSNYRYTCPTTVASGTINISGPDDLGNTLLYSSPTLDVYLNGSHLVNGLDYLASNGNTITLSEGLSSGDVLDVATLSAYDIGGLGGVSRIKAGPGIVLNPSSGLGEVTITGNTFQLTGGDIVIPVGSTRTYKKLSTAFNSMSSYLLDSGESSVTFAIDPEAIDENDVMVLNHPSGSFFTVSGSYQEGFVSTGINPVTNVQMATGAALSATFTFDNTLTNPLVNDYVSIWYVSGAKAVQNCSLYDAGATGQPRQYTNYNASENALNGNSERLLTSGTYVVYSVIRDSTAGSTLSGTYQTLSGIVTYVSSYGATVGAVYDITLSNTAAPDGTTGIPAIFNSASQRSLFMDYGTPEAWKGNRIIGATGSTDHTLTFSDARATNTYLNQGDCLLLLNQVVVVKEVFGNNTCIVTGQIRFPIPLGYTTTYASLPAAMQSQGFYYMVNSRLDYYYGSHRVAARSGSSVTIEVCQTVCGGLSSSATQGETFFPLPRWGVRSLGSKDTTSITEVNRDKTANRVLKSKINLKASPGIVIYGNKLSFDSLVFNMSQNPAGYNPLSTIYSDRLITGIELGTSRATNSTTVVNAPANVTMQHVVLNDSLSSQKPRYGIIGFNNTTLDSSYLTLNSQPSPNLWTQHNINNNLSVPTPLYFNSSKLTASYLAINGGYLGLYMLSNSTLSTSWLYVKNTHCYPLYIVSSSVQIVASIINNEGHYGDWLGQNVALSNSNYDYYVRGPTIQNCANPTLRGVINIGGLKSLEPGWLFDGCPGVNMLNMIVWNCTQNSSGGSYGSIQLSSCVGTLLYFSFIVEGFTPVYSGNVSLLGGTSLKICDTTISRGSYGIYLQNNSDVTYVYGGTRNTTFIANDTCIITGSNCRVSLDTIGAFNYLNYLFRLDGSNTSASLTSVRLRGTPATLFLGITPNAAAWVSGNSYVSYS
jgi:hypothetical protein